MIIGICGKTGSGKTALANFIKNNTKKEVIHVEVDKIGHDALKKEEIKNNLIKAFGKDILTDNEVDRKKLRKIVFQNEKEMDILTKYTWDYMKEQLDRTISNIDQIIILDWILLSKTEFFDLCDVTVLLDIPKNIRKKRVLERDHLTEEEFNLREQRAPNYDKDKFTIVLENTDNDSMKRLVKYL